MTTRRLPAVGLLAVAALGLSACGGSDDATVVDSSSTASSSSTSESSTTEPTDTESTTSESATESTSSPTSAAAPAELTDPGTELAIGEVATVPQGDEGATVGVTLTKVTKGTSADLSALKDADKYKGFTPVYVHYTMSGTDSSNTLGGDILDDVDPILVDGRKASTLIIIGTSPFKKCDRNSIPDDFGPGDTETTCQVAMVTPDQEVAGAQYAPYEGDYSDDGAVVWNN